MHDDENDDEYGNDFSCDDNDDDDGSCDADDNNKWNGTVVLILGCFFV